MTQVQSHTTTGWTINEWLEAYRNKALVARTALHALRAQLSSHDTAWIYIVSAPELDQQISELETLGDADSLPLY